MRLACRRAETGANPVRTWLHPGPGLAQATLQEHWHQPCREAWGSGDPGKDREAGEASSEPCTRPVQVAA